MLASNEIAQVKRRLVEAAEFMEQGKTVYCPQLLREVANVLSVFALLNPNPPENKE